MKFLLVIVISIAGLQQTRAQLLPACIMQEIAVGYDNSKIRIVLYKMDTCYIIESIPDPSKATRHEILLYNRNRQPDQVHPRLYTKACRHLLIPNKNLQFTLLEYNCKDVKQKK